MTDAYRGPVMIIEDDDDIRMALSDILQDEGYEVRTALNGKDALDKLRDGSPAPRLILLDLMMPVMDGPTFRKEQLRDPALAKIPVVVITADMHGRRRMKDLRPDGFLTKPMALTDLYQAAARFC